MFQASSECRAAARPSPAAVSARSWSPCSTASFASPPSAFARTEAPAFAASASSSHPRPSLQCPRRNQKYRSAPANLSPNSGSSRSSEGRPQVVVLGLKPLQPLRLLRTRQLGLLGQAQEVSCVRVPDLFGLPALP